MKKTNRKLFPFILLAVLLCAALIAASAALWPWFSSLSTEAGQEELRAFVSSMGVLGWAVMLGLQVLQIVVAVIPGEPVEILMGALYGAWGGFLTCELGVLIGSCGVFYAVRALGTPLVRAVFGEEKLRSFAFLQNTQKLEALTFLLFFIPGTPKDVLTYVAGLTPIRPLRFLGIALFARIPSILSSTWGGSSLAEGDWVKSLLIFAVVGSVSLIGIWAHKKLMERIHRKEGPTEA